MPPSRRPRAAAPAALRVDAAQCGAWELRCCAGPMLRTAETRSLCQSWLAPKRPWCVGGPGPPVDCPCGALNLCGVAARAEAVVGRSEPFVSSRDAGADAPSQVAAHVPDEIHGRSFVEATHARSRVRTEARPAVATRARRSRAVATRPERVVDASATRTGGRRRRRARAFRSTRCTR